jgi:hypothetical protein
MNNTKSALILVAFSFVPYLAVAWGYKSLVDGGSKEFWTAVGILVGVRLFFSIIETLGGILSWRAYGRSVMVQRFLELLRTNSFPKRTYAHDDFLNYLARIDDDPACPHSVKASAKEIHFMLEVFESLGILLGMRMHSAAELALEQYSPRTEAPVYGASAA